LCRNSKLEEKKTVKNSKNAAPKCRCAKPTPPHQDLTLSNADGRSPVHLVSHQARPDTVLIQLCIRKGIEEIEALEGNVDQIRCLLSGIYQSSALSLERLRNHQRSQQQMLDEADRSRKMTLEQLRVLQAAREHVSAMSTMPPSQPSSALVATDPVYNWFLAGVTPFTSRKYNIEGEG
jgi:hypothetical protein